MRCERAQELFSDYCEGLVPVALKVPLENHFETCIACKQGVSGLRETWTFLDQAPRMEAPSGFRAMVLQQIEAGGGKRGSLSWLQRLTSSFRLTTGRQRLAWGAAAVLLIAFAGVAIPGRYNPASLAGFGSSSKAQFQASRPTVQSESGSTFLNVPICVVEPNGQVQDNRSTSVQVRVLSGPVSIVGSGEAVLYGKSPATIRLRVLENATADPAVLELSRLDGRSPSTQILTIPVPRR